MQLKIDRFFALWPFSFMRFVICVVVVVLIYTIFLLHSSCELSSSSLTIWLVGFLAAFNCIISVHGNMTINDRSPSKAGGTKKFIRYIESTTTTTTTTTPPTYLAFLCVCEPLKRINAACVSFTINSLVLFQFYWFEALLHGFSSRSSSWTRTLPFVACISFYVYPFWGGGTRQAVNWRDTGRIEQIL